MSLLTKDGVLYEFLLSKDIHYVAVQFTAIWSNKRGISYGNAERMSGVILQQDEPPAHNAKYHKLAK